MKYIFSSWFYKVEIKTWDGKIIAVPTTYQFLLGKNIATAIDWFSSIRYTMIIKQD